MSHTLAVLLLALCCIAGLVLVPLGLPGLWVMVGGVLGYGALTGFRTIGVATIAIVLGLAFLGELLEWRGGVGLAEGDGGPRRPGWGALGGGVAGALGWGAVLGRAAGAAAKIALGVVIAVIGGFAAAKG